MLKKDSLNINILWRSSQAEVLLLLIKLKPIVDNLIGFYDKLKLIVLFHILILLTHRSK